ncbi:unnamed protein product [marine sediment metagenome]|uniref:HTH marR-type domain-containing protein n=1 Tax=marine sediment metagenome TaxID=412755 RepID=X1S4S5_9ZZZZ
MAISNPKLGEIQRLILLHTLHILDWLNEPEQQGKYFGWLTWGRDRISTKTLRERIFWIDELGVTASIRASFSRSLRQLESRGLIVSWNDKHDEPGYTTHISLTERGQKLAEELKAKG